MTTHSISIDRLGENYYLMIVIDGIDFVCPQTCHVRTNPKEILHEFLTISRLKISTIRFDDAIEFGKSSSFSMILSVNFWIYIHISKMRELRGRSEFAKSTFGALSTVPTCLGESVLILCVTSVVSTLIGLMSTVCRCGKSWTAFRLTRCVTIR